MQQFIFVISELVSIANFCNMFFGNTFYEKKFLEKSLTVLIGKSNIFVAIVCNNLGDLVAKIQLENISKRWGSFVGVDNFNLVIPDKEFLVLLGPSGCGKTTTMRMIAGLEEVTEGQISINDRIVNDLDPKDRDIAMVFQSYALYPNLNVYENIRFPLRMRKTNPIEQKEKVLRAAEMVELTDFLHRRPAELSGGQRQRVALARAIVREPNVFLMDEPLSNLDAKLRVSTRHQIKNLSHELQVTTIYVTHDQIEAMTLADRVVVMNKGVIQQVGTPTEIYDRPNNVFVAGFIGSPAMNLIEGEISNGSFEADNIKIAGFGKKLSGKITLGFRAEDAEMTKKGNAVAPLYSIELLGDATISTMRLGGAICSIKGPKDYRAEIGQSVSASIPQKACHLFDPQSGERIV
jgi:multiple sugar transport system ATP-binding protein